MFFFVFSGDARTSSSSLRSYRFFFVFTGFDMEVVELLLEHGANPSIKNDLGRDVLS